MADLIGDTFVALNASGAAHHDTASSGVVHQAKTVQLAEQARRLCFVRGFARYRSATDPLTEVPSSRLLP